jgi:hypothetical protein
MMDIHSFSGYGYSVWFVPKNYQDIQERYNIKHIPHITLDTNLLLKDAYHIYHNACQEVVVKLKPDFVKFPSFYHHDPMVSYGWYVDIQQMTKRKLNWTPHMTVTYVPRNKTNNAQEIKVLTYQSPLEPIECFVTIADTRSGLPEDWNISYTYFNLKASQSYSLSFDTKPGTSRMVASGIDEYIGINQEELDNLPNILQDRMSSCGIIMREGDINAIINQIKKQLDIEQLKMSQQDKMEIS